MKIFSPLKMKLSKEPVVKNSIKKINKSMKENHGLFSFCDAAIITDFEMPIDLRDRLAKIYKNKGWKYVYHITSSELSKADNGLAKSSSTYFLFAQKLITKDEEKFIDLYHLI